MIHQTKLYEPGSLPIVLTNRNNNNFIMTAIKAAIYKLKLAEKGHIDNNLFA